MTQFNLHNPVFDDANLLNVAISRAKTRLCIVTNGNELPKESNLAQLIAYIQYNNFEVKESKLHSVFDLLYKQYTAELTKQPLQTIEVDGWHFLQNSDAQ